jgi:hypothetical protein
VIKPARKPVLSQPASALRSALFALHRSIVAIEREDYERQTGVQNPAGFLRLLVEHDAWSWLRPLSALIVRMDDPAEVADSEAAFFAETRQLLKPDSSGTPFQQRYAWLIERSVDVAYGHGQVVKAFKGEVR